MDNRKRIPRKQHVVPQFLLREWAFNKRRSQLWVYDKSTGRSRIQSIRDTAVQSDYYEVLVESGAMETLLATVESSASLAIKQIRNEHSLRSLDSVNIHNTALFLAIQSIRTPSFFSTTQRVLEKDAASVLIPRRTTPLLTSPKYINSAAALIRKRLWTLRMSPTGKEYILSDHPIGFQKYGNVVIRGFRDTFRDATIHLPISPIHCLLLFPKPRQLIPGTRRINDSVVLDEVQESTSMEIDQMNTHQVVISNRFVFDRRGESAFIDECLNDNPIARCGPLTTDIGAVTWTTPRQ